MSTNNDNTARPATSGGDVIRSLGRTNDAGSVVKTQTMGLEPSGDERFSGETQPLIVCDRMTLARYTRFFEQAERALEALRGPPPAMGLAVPAAACSVLAAPFLASANFTLGDTGGGGQSIVFTGTALDTVTSINFGGSLGTITGQTPTTLMVTLPTQFPGVVSVVATGPGGPSNGFSFEFWNPTLITSVSSVYDAEKGVTQAGGAVSVWADQTAHALDLSQATAGLQPTWASSAFGTLHGLTFNNAGANSNLMQLAAWHGQASGLSRFWVASYSGSNTTPTGYVGDNPYTVVGDSTGVVNVNAGHNAGQLSYQDFVAGTGWVETTRSSSLNDGSPRLYGWTHDTSGNLIAYVGATQQGATATGLTYDTVNTGWNTLGQGFGGNADGIDGTVGALVVIDGIIGGTDLTKLNQWAQQRFGTP